MRQGLFSRTDNRWDTHESQAALSPLLATLDSVVNSPEVTDERAVADACSQLSAWAKDIGRLSTSQAFAEAAAYSDSRDAGRAYEAGRAARINADYERAIHWFQRALGIARRQDNHIAKADTLRGWGSLETQRGDFAVAKKLFFGAWRAAKKARARVLAAYAQHDLFTLCALQKDFQSAAEHAAIAYRLYRGTDPRFQYFAHDLGQFWSDRGFFTPATGVLTAVLPLFVNPRERFQVYANLARAAGGRGDVEGFFQAWDSLTALREYAGELESGGLLSVALGAEGLNLSIRAAQAAHEAKRRARLRGVAIEEQLAEELIERIRRGVRPEAEVPAPPEISDAAALLIEVCRALASEP